MDWARLHEPFSSQRLESVHKNLQRRSGKGRESGFVKSIVALSSYSQSPKHFFLIAMPLNVYSDHKYIEDMI